MLPRRLQLPYEGVRPGQCHPRGFFVKQRYFILVLAHSVHGRIQRIHIPHSFIYAILALAVLGSFSVFGFIGSYGRMVWKVAQYNTLRE